MRRPSVSYRASSQVGFSLFLCVEEGELLQRFGSAGDDVRSVFELIEGGNKWNVHALYPPLESYVAGKVVLVGDAVS